MGVRQGDNLSPNLFKIFINDLSSMLSNTPDTVPLNNLDIHCLLYADDVVLLSTSANGLQQKINTLEDFCQRWCLSVNVEKTKVLVFNKAGKLLKNNFLLNNNILENVTNYRYLGVIFSASGTFSLAKDALYKNGLKCYFKLCKDILSFHPSIKTSLHILDHTIKPVLLYGSEIWGKFNPHSS